MYNNNMGTNGVDVSINSKGAWVVVSPGKVKETAQYILPIGWGVAVGKKLASDVEQAQQ